MTNSLENKHDFTNGFILQIKKCLHGSWNK